MTPELKNYIETEILPHAGQVYPAFEDIDLFVEWITKSLCIESEITLENLQTYLLQPKGDLLPKRRNIYLSYPEFDKLPLELMGTEQQGNFHKSLLTVIILPTELACDGEFWYLTDDEFEILKAVSNG